MKITIKNFYYLGALALLIFGSSFFSLQNISATFTDIDEKQNFRDAILYAQKEGIIKGYGDGTFQPDRKINRAEFTKIIINSAFEENEIYGKNCFPDVKNEWFAKYVCTAKRENIINGYPDKTFRPNNEISFAESAKIILLGFDILVEEGSDIWYEPFITNLSLQRTIPTTITDINKKITRGEMVEMIWRTLEDVKNEDFLEYENGNFFTQNATDEENFNNLGAGYDNDGNGPICTADAKSCGDGTFVGRTGPNCEFAKCPGFKLKPDFVPTEANPIQLPGNVMTVEECTAAGGEVFNTLGKTSSQGELIGKIEELFCPCACLIRSEESNTLWVNIDGNIEEFTGNLDDIKTYNDCKDAGFKITDNIPEICTVGEPHMTGGRYKTFENNPMEAGKTCTDYTHSNCPGSCVAKCTPSSCGEPFEDGTRPCTSDCDGAGSCTEK